LFASVSGSGCATAPAVRLHVDPAGLARLAPTVRQPFEDRARATQDECDRDRARADERVTKAELALKQAREDASTPAEIRDAKVARAEADVRWQRALVEVVRWRAVVASADLERAKAEQLRRAGQDVDVDAFSEQHARLRERLNESSQRATAERVRFEARERALNAAKERYTATHAVATTAH
jgi:hypothetical protein